MSNEGYLNRKGRFAMGELTITEIKPDDRIIFHVEGMDAETHDRMKRLLQDQQGERILLLSGKADLFIVRGAR